MQRLFVYGTLAPGQPNGHILEAIGGSWCRGKVRGTLHAQGWGATLGYPAIVLDEHGEEVGGFVFHSEKLAAHWSRLDEFEGEAYERVCAEITLEDGATVRAWVYVLRGRGQRGSPATEQ